MRKKPRFTIEGMEVGFSDDGLWSYELQTDGDNPDDMFADAYVSAIDQDGGEVYTVKLSEMDNDVQDLAEKAIVTHCERAARESLEASREWSTNQKISEAKEIRE